MTFAVLILAAGQGVRMRSTLPKVLHTIGDLPMVAHVIKTAKKLNPQKIIVVNGHKGDLLIDALSQYPELIFAEQKDPKGTGDAVRQALQKVTDVKNVLILCGDAPLIKSESLQELINLARASQASLGIVTAHAHPPTGFGRILRDSRGQIIKIVEEKEASPEEKEITEINTGIFWCSTQKLQEWLPRLSAENAQKEFYLTDIVSFALQEKLTITSLLLESSTEALGINDKKQLALLERIYQAEQAEILMQHGVTLLDPARIDIRGEIKVGKDIEIDINVILQGNVVLEDEVNIGPNVIIKNSTLQKGTKILANSIIEDAIIGPHSAIGPFARIRPGTVTAEGVKIGNFVEIKNSQIGKGSKINHLSYVGDATVGKKVNIGAGTITCNYDGKQKHPTIIGDGAFIGSDTQLIAPVTIGEGVTIGAGTTVVKDVPPHHLIHNKIQHTCVEKEE